MAKPDCSKQSRLSARCGRELTRWVQPAYERPRCRIKVDIGQTLHGVVLTNRCPFRTRGWERRAMHAMKAYLPPLARFLMSSLFIWDGTLQLRDPTGTAKYFANVHVPIPDVAV